MKRIGLYLVSFSGGGAEREMIYLANEFARKGYLVDLIVHRDSGPLESLVSGAVNKLIIDKTYGHDVLYLAKYMRKNKPQFMLSTLHMPNWTLAIAKLLSFTKTKISWRIVISLSESKKDGKGIVSKLLNLCYPILSRNVNNITCVSKGVAEDLITNFSVIRKKVNVMYNPAYTSDIHYLAKEKVKHPWFEEKYKTITSLGRLSSQKDFRTLISAFKIVNQQVPEARLLILGEGSLRSELQTHIDTLKLSNVVELHGFELNPYKYLAKSNMFVLSSIYEGFGNVIVEALALNIPVVSTDCPSGPSEILNYGEWGELVAIRDIDALSDAILLTFGKEHLRDTLARAREFSVESVVNNYIDLMQ